MRYSGVADISEDTFVIYNSPINFMFVILSLLNSPEFFLKQNKGCINGCMNSRKGVRFIIRKIQQRMPALTFIRWVILSKLLCLSNYLTSLRHNGLICLENG